MTNENYEVVIGLEVHAALKTKTKMYCSCSTEYGKPANTNVCPVCLGFPGTLPVVNGRAIEMAVKAGLIMDCSITEFSKQDRKNYFYPDLPKGYQDSQYDLPLCENGKITLDNGKVIGITRIHIEEDAGKLSHTSMGTFVDFNRGGVPLIEIVSEPDMRSSDEAKEYLEKLRTMLVYADICDGKMNEGSLRCDVNVSVMKKGSKEFGTRTEMKNMNSFSNAVKAMEYEAKRQIEVIEAGGTISQETRRWDEKEEKTIAMRSKENAKDYRYFPEPDLVAMEINEAFIENVRKEIPEMPAERKARYVEKYNLSDYDADAIAMYKSIADYFEEVLKHTDNSKAVANYIMGEVYRLLDEHEKEEGKIPFGPEMFAELIKLIDNNVISNSVAKEVFAGMWNTGKKASDIVEEKGLGQINDDSALQGIIDTVIANNEQSVIDYKNGKDRAIKALMGQVMKETKGKANPKLVNEMLVDSLNK
ncbi:MAG: Asp-tRNA(Asn)/Glu-tRNA(Gln) amidotransferase subunit GatB [Clostridia bacterium]|jgi:aspartyl-tRNA(Asn)/glutamyl-tRNA(Gln) amidotransferase subunit B|nr:Asp-tRNA(Asn)/Glu-tRNA(Gln) amidotransferase subunit GatB [Clostridia bacterium]